MSPNPSKINYNDAQSVDRQGYSKVQNSPKTNSGKPGDLLEKLND